MTQPNPSPNSFMQQNERNASRTRSPRGKSPSGRMSRWPCKDYLKGPCNNSFCEKWHLPECLFHKTKSGCRFGEKCSYAHRQVDEQPSKRSKKNDDKSAVAILKKNDLHDRTWQLVVNRDKSHDRPGRPDVKRETCHELKRGPVGRRSSNARHLGCVFQDMKPPKSILRKSSYIQKPIQRVKFTLQRSYCVFHFWDRVGSHARLDNSKSFHNSAVSDRQRHTDTETVASCLPRVLRVTTTNEFHNSFRDSQLSVAITGSKTKDSATLRYHVFRVSALCLLRNFR